MKRITMMVAGLALAVLVWAPPVHAQIGQIAGRVIDRSTDQPLVGAQVYLEGTALGTLTQEDGRYLIANVPAGTYTVIVQLIGYAMGRSENVVVRTGAPVVVDFEVAITALRLEEVVVTGTADPIAGVKVPFTVGKVTKQDLPVPATRVESSLQGRVAGVRVSRQSGQPGEGVDVLLRGATSIITTGRSNEPLYVVDGVILGSSTVDIDAMDIENIEVVKGAAAASLYGSRASAGVVQITTSRGRDVAEGSTRFLVRSEYGFNRINLRRNYITRHHHYLVDPGKGYVDANGNAVAKEQRVADPDFMVDNEYPGPIFDHLDLFFNPGSYLRNSISISQNTRSTNFMVSFNAQNDQGVVSGLCDPEFFNPPEFPVPEGCGNDGAWLYGMRANLDHRLRDDLNFSVSTYYSRYRQEDYGGGDVFYDIMFMPPDVDLRSRNADGEPFLIQPDAFTLQENPLYNIAFGDSENVRSRFSGSMTARYSPANWFSIETNASFDRSDRHGNSFTPIGFKSLTSVSNGSVSRSNGLTQALNANVTASFLHSFGNLTARTKVQYLLEKETNDSRNASGSTLAVTGVPDIDVATTKNAGSGFTEVRSLGYYAITGLDYRGKYIGEAMIRRDGSSLFGPDDRWHNYYRLSGAWRVSEEPWWFIPALNEFKLRYSIGTAGGRPGFDYRYEVWNVSSGNVSKGTLGNKDLRPEHQTEQEFGIDMIASSRYSLQLVYAKSRVEDQLLQIPLPGVYGYGSQWQNAGTLESTSYEATLEALLLERPNLRWSVNLVADRTRSEITEFNRSCFGNTPFYCAGELIGTLRGKLYMTKPDQIRERHAGAADQFQVNDDGILVWVGPGNTWRDGLAKNLWGTRTTIDGRTYEWGKPITVLDASGNDIVKIADTNPDLNLGFSSSLQWKGFTLYGLLDAKIGGDIYNNTRQWAYRDNTHADYDQAGKPDELKKPVQYYQALYSTNAQNSWFVEDGTYLKLRDVVLQYRIRREHLRRFLGGLGMEHLTIGVTGRNLFTWTDYTGFDPEVGSIRTAYDGFDYPNFRTFTIKADVQF